MRHGVQQREIVTGVGDLVQRTRDGRTGQLLGGRVIKRLGGAVCGLHRARRDEKREFIGYATKPNRLRFIGYVTKPTDGGRRGTRVEI
jgi:hypothetical protein